MRASLLIVVGLLAMAAVVSAQSPVAPIVHRDNLAGDITSCPIGQGLATNQKPYRCAPCLAGYYKADTSLTGCLPCAVNSWSPQGDKTCYWCPAGTSTEGNTASAACTECPYGQVLDYAWTGSNDALRCKKCAVNQYQPLAGQKACLSCPAGMTTQGADGAGECFAVGGGNTIANVGANNGKATGAAQATPASSLLQILSKKATKPTVKGTKPTESAPIRPQIVKRASYKGRSAKAPKAPEKRADHRANAETAAQINHAKSKASRAKKSAKKLL